jgi:hypothetical protein
MLMLPKIQGGVARWSGRGARSVWAVRFGWVVAVIVASIVASATPAAAEPIVNPVPPGPEVAGTPGTRMMVDTPVARYATPAAPISSTIYLERCSGGCTVNTGNNDARTNTSSISKTASFINEFRNTAGQTGDAATPEWAQIVQCMKEVYSPYNVTVTDVKPASGASFHEAVIAGSPAEMGLDSNILGVAPLANDCSAIDNVMSFTFANRHGAADRVLNICWTAAQESAHAFGLDHEYSFPDNRSACNDPMTYRDDCGGEKFFRNDFANCGETASRACRCGALQNSHLKVLGVFGAGTPITGKPTITMVSPAAGEMLGRGVTVQAGAKRGVARVELYFNNYKWTEVAGAAFGKSGQADPSSYTLLVPAALPDSVVDVKAIAYDDLEIATESAVVTVTKGAPCATAATCATGQKCEAGKCFWDPPAGEIGDDCAFQQFCKSGLCTGTAQQQICTQACTPGAADSCPSGLDCVASSANAGVCFFQDSGGCCSVDHGGGAWWVHAGISALVLGLMLRRRQR